MDFDATRMSIEEMKELSQKLKKGKKKPIKFDKESDLCAAFVASLSDGWTAYPETAGFDILLVRKSDGFQIGIEAKLKLNAKVICQIAERTTKWYVTRSGTDCRAILVPDGVSSDLSSVCRLIGVTVIRQKLKLDDIEERKKSRYGFGIDPFYPNLPTIDGGGWSDDEWHEFAPEKRCDVPDYIPDVGAGNSSPVQLTQWKVKAIKIAITLEKDGFVTRKDFKHHDISMSRWTQGLWLLSQGNGRWVRGANMPDFRKQHPVNYEQIEKDFEHWKCQ